MRKELGVVVIILVFLVGISATLSLAQQKQAPDRVTIERERTKEGQPAPDGNFRFEFERELQGPEGMPPPGMPGDFVFIANEMNFGGKVVKGAPYSAQAVTESVQNLSDGNRIINKSTSAIYRDSEGRTRREQTLRTIGGFANSGDAPQTVFINDPVAGTSYTLDPRSRTARKMPPMNFKFEFRVPGPGEKGEKGERRELPPGGVQMGRVERQQIEIAHADILMKGGPGPETRFTWGWGNHAAKDEPLGKQNIEGVEAEGTRSTTTIPAGEIGNERAIEIVNERWYSAELQTTVMTRHSDPRFGETTYRLTNIDRSEPSRTLFEVPADYTIKTRSMGHGEGSGSGSGSGSGGGTGGATWHRAIEAPAGEVLNGRAITLPKPRYSPAARSAHVNGTVTVNITIDEEGNVTAAKAVSGHPLLQSASVEAARNAKFSPTKVSGQAVKVQGVLVYAFPGDSGQTSQEKEW